MKISMLPKQDHFHQLGFLTAEQLLLRPSRSVKTHMPVKILCLPVSVQHPQAHAVAPILPEPLQNRFHQAAAISASHGLRQKVQADQLTEAQLALTEQYEANLALEDEVTNTQLALTELYEANQTTTTTKEA